MINSDGSKLHPLTNPRSGAVGDVVPDWSPGGHEIAFDSDRSGHDRIYLMNADGSNQRALTK